MPSAYLVLLIANAIYGTSYVTSRVVLQDVPPAALAVARLALGAAVIVPFALAGRQARDTLSRSDRWRVFWMGVLGFAGAFGFGNLGIAHSTATNTRVTIASTICNRSDRSFSRGTGCTLHLAAGRARSDRTRHTE